MASEVDICNLALSHLGDEATVISIDPPEGSAQADHCARFYPIARDALLEMVPGGWSFATRRVSGAPLAPLSASWAYAYARPNAAQRVLSVLAAGAPDDYASDPGAGPQPFAIETMDDGTEVILTNTENAVIRYAVGAIEPGKFPPMFTTALSHLLASYLAGPVLKGDAGRAENKAQLQLAQVWAQRAMGADAAQRRVHLEHIPASIGARR